MKIGVYIGNMNPNSGGGYTFQAELLKTLFLDKTNKHSFIFFSNSVNSVDKSLPIIGLQERYGCYESGNYLFRYLKKKLKIFFKFKTSETTSLLQKAVDEYSIDIVWFISPQYQKINIPFFYTVWDLQHRLQPFFPEVSVAGWKWDDRDEHYRSILPKATKVITGTITGKKEIITFYNIYEKNISVIPFPAPTFSMRDTAPLDIKRRFGLKDKYIIYPAQFWPHKNHANLILAISLLKKQFGIKVHCVFTGEDKGNLEFIKNLTVNLGLEEQIYFLGFVSRNELANLYVNAIAMCYASFFGPDNLPPLEAFSLGCPVLAANVDGAKEQMGNAVLYFKPDNVVDISKSLKLIIDDCGDLRKKLIERGYDQVKNKTSINYINSIYKIIDDFESIKHCWGNYISKK